MKFRPLADFLYARPISTPPIIIFGMHRSGTGLLVRSLERCGVFIGSYQARNNESRFFSDDKYISVVSVWV